DPAQPGIRRVRRGRGFSFHDPDGEPLDDRTRERIEALVIPPAWRDVWICPNASGHLQAVGVDDAGRKQYLYHDQWHRAKTEEKHDRVLELARLLPDFRKEALGSWRPAVSAGTVFSPGRYASSTSVSSAPVVRSTRAATAPTAWPPCNATMSGSAATRCGSATSPRAARFAKSCSATPRSPRWCGRYAERVRMWTGCSPTGTDRSGGRFERTRSTCGFGTSPATTSPRRTCARGTRPCWLRPSSPSTTRRQAGELGSGCVRR